VKHSLTRLAVGLLLVATMGGCAQLQSFEQKVQTAYDALSTTQVSYNYVNAGIQAFQGLQKLGAAYLRLPTCTATSGSVCHDRRATAPIRAAFVAGRQARADVLAYMDAHPCVGTGDVGTCPLMPNGVYAGLQSAMNELNTLYSTYKVNLTGAQ
jgi:hypothetical protein